MCLQSNSGDFAEKDWSCSYGCSCSWPPEDASWRDDVTGPSLMAEGKGSGRALTARQRAQKPSGSCSWARQGERDEKDLSVPCALKERPSDTPWLKGDFPSGEMKELFPSLSSKGCCASWNRKLQLFLLNLPKATPGRLHTLLPQPRALPQHSRGAFTVQGQHWGVASLTANRVLLRSGNIHVFLQLFRQSHRLQAARKNSFCRRGPAAARPSPAAPAPAVPRSSTPVRAQCQGTPQKRAPTCLRYLIQAGKTHWTGRVETRMWTLSSCLLFTLF